MWYFFTIIALVTALASVRYAYNLYQGIMAKDPGDEAMQKIARAIQDGARAFLHAEYKWLGIFVGVVSGKI